MGVIRPRRPASQTLGTVQAAQSADTRQHRRLLSDLQIPKPMAGGRILGIAEVDSVASSVKHGPSGFDNSLVQYEAPWDYGIDGLMSAGEFCTVSANEVQLTAGEYEIACRFSYGWAAGVTPPPAVQVALVNVGAASDAFYDGYDQMFPTFTQEDGRSGICPIVGPFGRTIVGSGGSWFRVEATCNQPVAAGTAVSGIAGDPGLHWSIKKYA